MEFLDIIRKEGTLKKSLIIATGLAKDYAQMYHAGEWNSTLAMISDSKPRFTRRRDGQPVTPGCFIRTQGYKVYWYKFRSIEHAKAFALASQQQISTKQDRWSMNAFTPFTLDIGILETIFILTEANSPFTYTKEAFDSLHGHISSIPYGI